MKECPRCFWLIQHKVWKRPEGIRMTLPNGMDGILKKHFDKFRERKQLPPEICNNGHCKDMRLFDDMELLKVWRNNFKGVRFQDEEGNILSGAVDDVLKTGNKLIVMDYKTRGYALKEDTHEFYQDQLDIYSWLFQKNGYEVEDYGFLLFYYPKEVLETGEVVFHTELKKMKVHTANAEKIWKEALKLLKGDCPQACCEWCDGR